MLPQLASKQSYKSCTSKLNPPYIKSLVYYVRAESKLRDEKRYDVLTQLYFNMGLSAYRLSTIDKDGATAFHSKKSILRQKTFLKPKRYIPGAEVAQQ